MTATALAARPLDTRPAKTTTATKARAATKRPVSQFDLYPLPFFKADAPEAHRTWAVTPTGRYGVDCDTGAAFAKAFLKTADGTVGWSTMLTQVVAGMVATIDGRHKDGAVRMGGVAVGFLSTIGRVLNAACTPAQQRNGNAAPDEIFDLIEDHRAASIAKFKAGRTQSGTIDLPSARGYDAKKVAKVRLAWEEKYEAFRKASELLCVYPVRSLAGALALMDYIELFNSGGVVLDDEWKSSPEEWPMLFGNAENSALCINLYRNARRGLPTLPAIAAVRC